MATSSIIFTLCLFQFFKLAPSDLLLLVCIIHPFVLFIICSFLSVFVCMFNCCCTYPPFSFIHLFISYIHSAVSSIHCLSRFSSHFPSGCDQILTKDFGQFSTRNIKGKYANNLDCTYDINLMDQNKGIKLTWTEFDIRGNMPDCENDYMEIFIGCSYKSIGRYCSDNVAEGGSRIFDVYSPDNCLRLKFHTDSSTTGRGFEATYKTVDMSKSMGRELECICSSCRCCK